MITENDRIFIEKRGSNPGVVLKQISDFKKGFDYLRLVDAASVGNGIIRLDNEGLERFIGAYGDWVTKGGELVKFVPASGAASRMFKALFEALDDIRKNGDTEKTWLANKAAKQYCDHVASFAFYPELKNAIASAGADETPVAYMDYLLNPVGLNYGALPKGLLKFHRYGDTSRTPFEEHLAEGAMYARDARGKVKIHFTVSPEHQKGFETLLADTGKHFEEEWGVTFEITFSQQKPSTDTIAVDSENEPFRESDGSLLFRPGGHGALIENLNDLDADIIFIKNIDNVVPDHLKKPTIDYKKAIAGILLHYQQIIFGYQKELNEKHPTALDSGFLAEAANFLENELNVKPPVNHYYTEKDELCHYLREKYNRPIRVCGMVKNEGEPGGGPFLAVNSDGTVSLQVVESSQIDPANGQQQAIARKATHFNPVDLVCGVKNYKGEKFDLTSFTDPETGFISVKSKDGKELKAQELPGLWNGAMSNWNTLFVEVPIETFNPVKTVNDLLREQHR